VVHGEAGPAAALADTIGRRPGWRAAVAIDGDTVPLHPSSTSTPG
jgi:hypothetical protein